MARPQSIRGPREKCLRIQMMFSCADPKGNTKKVTNTYDFARQGGGAIPEGNKLLFVTNGATGFWDLCGAAILACLNARATLGKVLCRWLSDAYDPYEIAVAGPLAGAVGTIATSLPLEVAVTVQKKSRVKGRSFNSSNKYSPIDLTFAGAALNPLEELSAAGLAAFHTMRDLVNQPIGDGAGNELVPVIVSQSGSQIRINPTIIRYAEMNPAAGSQLLDSNLGTMRRRQDRRVGATT